jgi:hypothetical protein
MPGVTIHIGLSFPGRKEFTNYRADVTFTDIDVDGDIEEQCEACVKAADTVTVFAEGALAQEAANASGFEIDGVGVEFAEFREKFAKSWGKLVDRVNDLDGGGKTTTGRRAQRDDDEDEEDHEEEEEKPRRKVKKSKKAKGKKGGRK